MKPVLDRGQSRAFDAIARDVCRVPGGLLMENAGAGATAVLLRTLLTGERNAAVVVAGTGNNGGDGFVIARHLAIAGKACRVFAIGEESRIAGDARTMLEAWRGVGGDVVFGDPSFAAKEVASAASAGVVLVDALFGTGLDRPLSGAFVELVGRMNALPIPRFAVDLPSGLDANTGATLGAAVHADVTVTFGHLKCGLVTPNGARLAGRVFVENIGVPSAVAARTGRTAALLDEDDLSRLLTRRDPGTHKHGAGHVLVIAGSLGKSGAALLAARGAMRAGAGLVTVASWPDSIRDIELRSVETMTEEISPERPMMELVKGKRSLVIGPGLGLTPLAAQAICDAIQCLAATSIPIVLDADAITLMASSVDLLRARPGMILTPHPGELARLLELSPLEIEADRFAAVRRAAEKTGSVVVLKGAHSLIAAPDGRVVVSGVVCPALATAGSGDVLGGVIAALATTMAPFEAAAAGALIHGLAGLDWQQANGDRGVLASEIADGVPRVLARFMGGGHA